MSKTNLLLLLSARIGLIWKAEFNVFAFGTGMAMMLLNLVGKPELTVPIVRWKKFF